MTDRAAVMRERKLETRTEFDDVCAARISQLVGMVQVGLPTSEVHGWATLVYAGK